MAEIQNSNQEGSKKAKRISTKVDMTPMVDLGFLLITFFMLATTFNKPRAMIVNTPDKCKDCVPPVTSNSNAFTIILGEKNKVYYYFGLPGEDKIKVTDFSSNGIRQILLPAKSNNQELVVMIKLDESSKFGNIVDILDEMAITHNDLYVIMDLTNEEKQLMSKAKNNIAYK